MVDGRSGSSILTLNPQTNPMGQKQELCEKKPSGKEQFALTVDHVQLPC